MRFIFAGTSLVVGTPKLWRFMLRPMLLGALVLLAMSAGAYWLIVPPLNARLVHVLPTHPVMGSIVAMFTSGLYFALLILTSGFLYLTAVSFFSASMWEKLSFEIEVISTGRQLRSKLTTGAIVRDSISRGAFAFALTLVSVCCGWTLFGIPAIILAGFLGLHDYTSSAYLRRGVTFASQRRAVSKLPGRFSFLLVAGLLTLLPIVNVLMLPCLVAGGTLMVIGGEEQRVESAGTGIAIR